MPDPSDPPEPEPQDEPDPFAPLESSAAEEEAANVPDPPDTEELGSGDEEQADRVDFGHGLVAERVGPPKPSEKGADRKPSEAASEDAAAGTAEPGRRAFLQKAGGVVFGTAIVAAPVAVAVRAVSSPLFEERKAGVSARLTTLDALVPGGPPQAFKVVADKTDAWTTYQDLPLGLVYVQRLENGELRVFSASCPHAGCAVEYRHEGKVKEKELGEHYYCPCHESAFALAGEIASAESPALRGLDALEVDEEKLAVGEVWVRFQKFKAGIEAKQPIA